MYYTNIIAMKNSILLEKVGEERKLSERITNIAVLAIVAQATSPVYLVLKYK